MAGQHHNMATPFTEVRLAQLSKLPVSYNKVPKAATNQSMAAGGSTDDELVDKIA